MLLMLTLGKAFVLELHVNLHVSDADLDLRVPQVEHSQLERPDVELHELQWSA